MALRATSSEVFVGGFACYWGARGGYVVIVSCEQRWVYACTGILGLQLVTVYLVYTRLFKCLFLCYTLKSISTAIILNLLLKEIRVLFLKVQKTFSSKRLAMWVLSICPSNMMWFQVLVVSGTMTTHQPLHCMRCLRNCPVIFRGGKQQSGPFSVSWGVWSWICFVQRYLC